MKPAEAEQLLIFMQPAMMIHFLPLSLKGTATASDNVDRREGRTLAFFQPIRTSMYNYFQPMKATK